jgi:hypothetical protein
LQDAKFISKVKPDIADKLIISKFKDSNITPFGELIFGGFGSKRVRKSRYATDSYRFDSLAIPQLFYNGKCQVMARYPNTGFIRIPINEVPKDPAIFKKWKDEDNLWLYGYWNPDWADAYEKIAEIADNGKITVEEPANRYGFGRRKGYAVNALCEIDMPGEWYITPKGDEVIYYPPENFDPQKITLTSCDTALFVENMENFQLRNINFEYIRGDAIIIKRCKSPLITGVNISNCSGMGIKVYESNNAIIHSSKISNMGRGGVDIISGDWKVLESGNSIIEDCIFTDLSHIDHTYTPALLLDGMGFKVRYNIFNKIPSSAIRIESSSNLIELNIFRNCVYESGDQGAIDMWANPLYRGNVIRWNYFDSIINNSAHLGAAAVRCDDFISGVMVANNIMDQGSDHGFGSVQFNKGAKTIVEGNLIVNWKTAFSGCSYMGKTWNKVIFKHERSKRLLETVKWNTPEWLKMYPMLKDLLNGKNNHNYFFGNMIINTPVIKAVNRGVFLNNISKEVTNRRYSLTELKEFTTPWNPIPIDKIEEIIKK